MESGKKYIKNDISKTRNTTLSKQKAKDIKKNILKTKNKKKIQKTRLSAMKKREKEKRKNAKAACTHETATFVCLRRPSERRGGRRGGPYLLPLTHILGEGG